VINARLGDQGFKGREVYFLFPFIFNFQFLFICGGSDEASSLAVAPSPNQGTSWPPCTLPPAPPVLPTLLRVLA
jgi:hypothetical protein